MELFLIAVGVLLVIIVILLMPGAAARQARIEHERTLDAMQETSDEAKQRITDLHRAYRAELARAAKRQQAPRRRTQ